MSRLVVFDLDGTLVDSEAGIVKAMERTVQAMQLPEETVAVWRKLIGVPLREQMPLILPPTRLAEASLVADCYRDFYRELMLGASDPFPGTDALLKHLVASGVTLAICSGKRGPSIRAVLDQAGWSALFADIVSPDDVERGKPDPESLSVVLHRTGFVVKDALMVGDTTLDMTMAQAIGMACCAVSWGTHTVEELKATHPNYWADTVIDLTEQIEHWLASP